MRIVRAIGCLSLICIAGGVSLGQVAEQGKESTVLRIRKLSGCDSSDVVKTPLYTTSAPRGVKSPGEWVRIEVRFDVVPEWLDELSVHYYALTDNPSDKGQRFSLFRLTADYGDIKRGKDLLCEAYLRPPAMERYGRVVGVAVEFLVGGKVVDQRSDETAEGRKMLPQNWWRDPKIVDSKSVVSRSGYLLERSKTPFGMVNWDDYLIAK